MFSRLRESFGTAGLILAVVALVAALGGSAIAANTATDSAKRNNRAKKGGGGAALAKKYAKTFSLRYSKAFAKRFASAGPAGPQGPTGPAGPKGDKGDDGANGSDGTNGTVGSDGSDGADGKTVLNGTLDPDDGLDGVDGDFYIRTDTNQIWGPKSGGTWTGTGPTDLQGPKGEPWTAGGTLPAGEILRGTWTAGPFTASAAGEPVPLSISYNIPIVNGIFGNKVFVEEGQTENPGLNVRCVEGAVPNPSTVPGDNGTVCVFATDVENWDLANSATTGIISASKILTPPQERVSGLALLGESTGAGVSYAHGYWAVKGN